MRERCHINWEGCGGYNAAGVFKRRHAGWGGHMGGWQLQRLGRVHGQCRMSCKVCGVPEWPALYECRGWESCAGGGNLPEQFAIFSASFPLACGKLTKVHWK